jgi:hypothetical protein
MFKLHIMIAVAVVVAVAALNQKAPVDLQELVDKIENLAGELEADLVEDAEAVESEAGLKSKRVR